MKGDDVTNKLGFCVRRAVWVGALCMLASGGGCPAAAPILHFGAEPLRSQKSTSEAPIKHPLMSSAINREVPRQLVMLVAREEFGLSTRDEALLESVDRQSEHFFRLDAQAWYHKSITLKVSRRGEELYARELRAWVPAVEAIPHSADRFYARSRAPLIKMFEAAGYKRRPNGVAEGSPPLPERVEAWLLTMDHPTQYRAVREIHRLIRDGGESVARLSGLVRGYANLSQLTMYTFDARSDAFAARALLYSERLAALAPDSPEPAWAEAYLSTLIGFPTWTIKALNAVKRLGDTGAQPPDWVALVDAYSRYQTAELTSVAIDEEHPLRGLAALLWFRASMHANNFSVMAATGREVMRAIPHCLWVVDALASQAGVSYGHMIHRYAPRAHAEQLAHVLADWPGLPDEAAGLVGGGAENLTLANRAAIANALIDAGVDDRAEPSLGVLGRNIEAYNVLQSVRYAMFLRHSLGTSASGWVAEIEPAIAGHPDAPLFRALASPPGANAQTLSPYLRRYRMKDSNYYSTRDLLYYLPRSTKLQDMTVQRAVEIATAVGRGSEISFIRQVALAKDAQAVRWANWMASASRNAPIRFATYIRYDWKRAKPKMKRWLDLYGDNPVVMLAAAERYLQLGNRERAEELFAQYLADAPDMAVFRRLAEVQYEDDPEEERWLATLAQALDAPDYGLSHADAAAAIGATLMRLGHFSRAKEWTERAAQSGSGWGMQLHADCLTALGEYNDAEQVAWQVTRRYGYGLSSDDWYYWCAENERGRLAEAWELKQARLRQSYPAGSREHEFAETLHLLVTGEPGRARQLLEERLAKKFSPFDTMMVASLCDERGLTDERDAALEKLATHDPGGEPKPELCRLAPVMQAFLASGEVDEEQLAAAVDGIDQPIVWKSIFWYFVGVAHETRGRRDKAIDAWRHAAISSNYGWHRTLAWRRLRNAGVEPAKIKGREFQYALLPAE